MTESVSNADVDLSTVSRDSAHSTTTAHRPADLDADAGPHAVEVLGVPKGEKPPAKKE